MLALAFVAVNATLYLVFRELWQSSSPLLGLLINASFQLFAIMTAWYAVTAQRSRDALAAVNADLLATRSLLAESVRDSERLRLSRELHDVAGHKLTALKLNLRRAAAPARAGATNAQLALCTQLADELLGDIRGVVQQMRLHDGVDLRDLIVRLAAPFPKPRLQPGHRPGPARGFAGAGRGGVAHGAGSTDQRRAARRRREPVAVACTASGDQLRLDLRDDGRGGAGELRFGNGLTGMRERLEAIGGGVSASRVRRPAACACRPGCRWPRELTNAAAPGACRRPGAGAQRTARAARRLRAIAGRGRGGRWRCAAGGDRRPQPVDVVLSDIRMPGLDGFGLLAALARRAAMPRR